jgi:hypothetical protein
LKPWLSGKRLLVTLLLTAGLAVGVGWTFLFALRPMFVQSPEPEIDGPEDATLVDRVIGTVVVAQREREILLLDLPSKRETRVATELDVVRVSGPTNSGVIAYIGTRGWWLTPVFGDVTELRLLTRDGATWQERRVAQLGTRTNGSWSLALSPKGDRIALGEYSDGFMRLFDSGGHELRRVEASPAISKSPWLDDDVLLFSRDLPSSEARRLLAGQPPRATKNGEPASDDRVRVCFQLDVRDSTERALRYGGSPEIRNAHRALLWTPWWAPPQGSESLTWVDPLTGNVITPAIPPPGCFTDSLALCGDNEVICGAWRTHGTPKKSLHMFLAGPNESWSLKIADLTTGHFATVVPVVGHGDMSFGARLAIQ